MYNKRALAILSAILGFFFGLCFYLLMGPGKTNSLSAILGGLLFCLALFTFFLIYGSLMDKRYAEFEKVITSPVFYKTNGNFNLGSGKVKNGNIYFCEEGIVCVCLDEKPYTLDKILLQDIDRYQFDDNRLNILTKDGRMFIITLPDAKNIIRVLKEKDWIVC